MDAGIDNALIQKKIVSVGNKYVEVTNGCKVKFHFQTVRADNGVLLDDSRTMKNPMDLVLGHKFKLEVWEAILKKMAVNEVAQFTVDKTLVYEYPFVSKVLRDVQKDITQRKHCCSMTLQNEGIGYKDLDEFLSNPCDLIFTIHLLSVQHPGEYGKETWQLNDEQKLTASKALREDGNKYFQQKDYENAERCYVEGVTMMDDLMLKEKPHDTDWLELAKVKQPLLLNYAQCRLIAKDYYNAILSCTEILKTDPKNVKALFRRGKAHAGAWNPREARADFEAALQLDPQLKSAVDKELKLIDEEQRKRDAQDKDKLKNLFAK